MAEVRQQVFDFDVRSSLGGEDFLVSGSNQAAIAWLDKWPDWPSPALIVYGLSGSGKSHIAHVHLARSSGLLVTPALIRDAGLPDIFDRATHFILDDADCEFDEEDLLHLYNGVAAKGGSLLLTASKPPGLWGGHLKDLNSRMKAAPAVEIGQPEDALLEAVLAKQFSDRQLLVDQEVVSYAVKRMERSLAQVRTIVEGADKLSLAKGQRVTLPLIRDVLAGFTAN